MSLNVVVFMQTTFLYLGLGLSPPVCPIWQVQKRLNEVPPQSLLKMDSAHVSTAGYEFPCQSVKSVLIQALTIILLAGLWTIGGTPIALFSRGIGRVQRIVVHIALEVHPGEVAYRIPAPKPPQLRMVVSMPVVQRILR